MNEEQIVIAFQAGALHLKKGVCPKCWSYRFSNDVCGFSAQFYTYEHDGRVWAWDAEKAIGIVKGRHDANIPVSTLMHKPFNGDPEHLDCIAKMIGERNMALREPGIVIKGEKPKDLFDNMMIDGSHRAVMYCNARVNMPVAIMTDDERAECEIVRGVSIDEGAVTIDKYTTAKVGAAIKGKVVSPEVIGKHFREVTGVGLGIAASALSSRGMSDADLNKLASACGMAVLLA